MSACLWDAEERDGRQMFRIHLHINYSISFWHKKKLLRWELYKVHISQHAYIQYSLLPTASLQLRFVQKCSPPAVNNGTPQSTLTSVHYDWAQLQIAVHLTTMQAGHKDTINMKRLRVRASQAFYSYLESTPSGCKPRQIKPRQSYCVNSRGKK